MRNTIEPPGFGRRFWPELRHWRCNRYSHGIPVRNKLGRLFAIRGRHNRTDLGDGRNVCVLPGKRLCGSPALKRKAIGSPVPLSRGGSGRFWKLAFQLLHREHEFLHAAPRRLPSRFPRLTWHRKSSRLFTPSVGANPIFTQSNGSARNRLVRNSSDWGVLCLAATPSRTSSALSSCGHVDRTHRVPSCGISHG